MASGWVGILSAELHFPEAHSLKEKRMLLRSAKEQLRNRFGAAVAEVDHHEVWQRARLTVAVVTREPARQNGCSPTPSGIWPRASGSSGRSNASSSRSTTTERAARYGRSMADRMRRVNESLRQVLSEALLELKDPRIGFVTVTGVDTSPDLRQAVVFVSVLGSEKKRSKSMTGLDAAHGVLQARISRELRLKRTPTLTFEYDHAVEHGVRMSKLIDELAPEPDVRTRS